ncbi:hypothetical protein G9A89_014435 [Geosiphon pyriformis]|nr:hypothetical protein G9A89_014435 [Geosiphon pyriformis]
MSDKSLRNLDSCEIKCKAATYFFDLDLGIGIGVGGLVSSTMAELQAIVLALECVLLNSSVKHLGVLGNEHADVLAGLTAGSDLVLSVLIKKKYIKTGGVAVSGNIQHIEVRSGSDVCLYDRTYPSVLCLHCREVKSSNHSFVCSFNSGIYKNLLTSYLADWCVMLLLCASDDVLYITVSKGFLFKEWFLKALSIFDNTKSVKNFMVNFVRDLGAAHCAEIWLVKAKYRIFMKKGGLIFHDVSAFSVIHGLLCLFLAEIIKLFGIAEALDPGKALLVFENRRFYKHSYVCIFFGLAAVSSISINIQADGKIIELRPPYATALEKYNVSIHYDKAMKAYFERTFRDLKWTALLHLCSFIPILGTFVYPLASGYALVSSLGLTSATTIGILIYMIPGTKTLAILFLETLFGSRKLTRELLEPYFARLQFDHEMKRRWFAERSDPLPIIGVFFFGVAQAAAALLLVKTIEPPPLPPGFKTEYVQDIKYKDNGLNKDPYGFLFGKK